MLLNNNIIIFKKIEIFVMSTIHSINTSKSLCKKMNKIKLNIPQCVAYIVEKATKQEAT
jgi:hypothetical protein